MKYTKDINKSLDNDTEGSMAFRDLNCSK